MTNELVDQLNDIVLKQLEEEYFMYLDVMDLDRNQEDVISEMIDHIRDNIDWDLMYEKACEDIHRTYKESLED